MTEVLEDFSDRVLVALADVAPGWRSYLLGEAGVSDDMPDASPEGRSRASSVLASFRPEFERLRAEGAAAAEPLTDQVLDHIFRMGYPSLALGSEGAGLERFGDPLGRYSSSVVSLDELLTEVTIGSVEDAEAFLGRIDGSSGYVDGVIETIEHRSGEGLRSTTAALESAVALLDAACAQTVEQTRCHVALAAALEESGLPSADRARLLQRADELIETRLQPALARLADRARRELPHGREELGLCTVPGGDEAYAFLVRAHTTMEVTPEQVHALGLEEVERLHDRIRTSFAELGVEGGDVGDLYRLGEIWDRWSFEPGDRAAVLEEVHRTIDRATSLLRPLFNRWPSTRSEVKEVPAEFEDTVMSHAMPPRARGGAGAFVVNVRDALNESRLSTRVTTFHEAVPGHVLQMTVAAETPELPRLRRLLPFTAYLEGWAKYSEILPVEHGVDDDPHFELVRMQKELYSTANLVADTGCNALGWDTERVKKYVSWATGNDVMLPPMIAARTVYTPGQLLGYKTGLLGFLKIRDRARQALGDRFALPAFHDALLVNGPLPLDMLETTVLDQLAA